MPASIQIESCVIINAEGQSFDMTGTVMAFAMYESLFTNTMTANAVIRDTANVQEMLPIVGTETFYLSYFTQSGSYDMLFDVVSIRDIKSSNQETKTFELELASIQTVTNNNIKLKTRYTGSTSAIVENVLGTTLGINSSYLSVEPTSDSVDILPPSLSPFKFINWLSDNIGNNGNDHRATYYFYETSKGTYFASLERMKELPVFSTFTYGEAKENSVRDDNRILNYTLGERFDTLTNLPGGAFAGTVYTHDIINKKLTKTIGRNPNKTLLSYRDGYSEDSNISLMNNVDAVSLLQRNFVNGEFNHHKLLIEINGNGANEVGDKVQINIPTTRKTDAKTHDVALSGEYIITKIKHHMTSTTYKMIIELNKYDH